MKRASPPFTVRVFLRSRRGLSRLISLVDAAFTGFWLGVLNRDALHRMDEQFYNSSSIYAEEEFNRSGFFDWEAAMVSHYFQGCRRILVGAAGAGREMLELHLRGIEADGFECHPDLREIGNRHLAAEGIHKSIMPAPRDGIPTLEETYDGLIVGWSAYTLIQGRARRIAFLQSLLPSLTPNSPILLSFHVRSGSDTRFRIIIRLGNLIRMLLHRERLELGDDLEKNYVHRFTKDELAEELAEAGFEFLFYDTKGCGHAVSRASPPAPRTNPFPKATQ